MNPEPAALPWFKSPVYVTGITQLLSMIVVALGLQTLYPIEIINVWVEIAFVVIGLVAGVIGEHKRRTSKLQPITLTQLEADKASLAILVPPSMAARTSATRTPNDLRPPWKT